MPLEVIESEQVLKDVTFLEDVKVKYVSLVRHGANREPFKIMKREGKMKNDHVIQAVLLPKGKSLSDFAAQEGLTWLNAVKGDKATEREGYTELVQCAKSKFKSLTEPQALGASGVSLILGVLKDEREKDDLITAPTSMLSSPMVTEAIPFNWSAGELLYREVDALLSTVHGAAEQAGYSKEERTTAILTAAKAFYSFMESWAGKLGETPTAVKQIKTYVKTDAGGGQDMTPEETKTLVTEMISPIMEKLSKMEEANAAKAVEAPPAAVTEPLSVAITPLEIATDPEMVEMKSAVKYLFDRAKAEDEKDKHALVTDPKTPKQDGDHGETVQKADDKKTKSVFAGTIFNTAKLREIGIEA